MLASMLSGRVFIVGVGSPIMGPDRVYEDLKPLYFLHKQLLMLLIQRVSFVVMSTAAVTGCPGGCGLSMR
jgi:hypothetical protein